MAALGLNAALFFLVEQAMRNALEYSQLSDRLVKDVIELTMIERRPEAMLGAPDVVMQEAPEAQTPKPASTAAAALARAPEATRLDPSLGHIIPPTPEQYCQRLPPEGLSPLECALRNGAEARQAEAAGRRRGEEHRFVPSDSVLTLLNPRQAQAARDARIIRGLQDFRRSGVELMMDPVPALLGRSAIPDPSWTLRDDSYLDRRAEKALREAVGEHQAVY